MRNIQVFSLILMVALICNSAYGQTVGRSAVSAAGETFLGFNRVPDGIYILDVIDPVGRILQTLSYSNCDFFYLPLDVSQLKEGIYFKVVDKLNFQGQVKLIEF